MADPSVYLVAGFVTWHLGYYLHERLVRRVPSKKARELRELFDREPQAYYRTKHWRDLRIRVKKRDDYQCRTCWLKDVTGSFPVHHRTYDRVGCEKLEDLVNLCEGCHRAVHEHSWVTRKLDRLRGDGVGQAHAGADVPVELDHPSLSGRRRPVNDKHWRPGA